MKHFAVFTFLMLMAVSVQGQSVEEYFHGGAQSFINGDLQTAIAQVETGLSYFPDDPKLNALMQKLQEEQEKQQQQQQNQNEQNNQDQNQENQENQQNEQEQDNEQQNDDEQQGGENQQGDNQDVNPEDLKSQQISKEDAEKILKALAQKEKELLKEFKKKKTDGSAKHEKDW